MLAFGDYLIRHYQQTDLERLVQLANNPRIACHLRDAFPSPYREQDAVAWYQGRREPHTAFAIAGPDGFMGSIGLILGEDIYRKSAEIGYWLGEPYWGRGIITAALKVFAPYAMREYHLVRLYAGVFESNPASCRVLEKAGFTKEAVMRKAVFKQGQLLDQHLYSLISDEVCPK